MGRESTQNHCSDFTKNVAESFADLAEGNLKLNVRFCRFVNHPIRMDELKLMKHQDERDFLPDDYTGIRERGACPPEEKKGHMPPKPGQKQATLLYFWELDPDEMEEHKATIQLLTTIEAEKADWVEPANAEAEAKGLNIEDQEERKKREDEWRQDMANR